MIVPGQVRNEVRDRLWAEADRLDWAKLSTNDKARWFTRWTKSAEIGGKLAAFMDPRQIRVYLKDTLLKGYARERMADPQRIFRILRLSNETETVETYIKPHGVRLDDGRIIAWSKAMDWKLTLLAIFERAFEDTSFTPHAAVLFQSATKHTTAEAREIVEEVARRLGVARIIWLD